MRLIDAEHLAKEIREVYEHQFPTASGDFDTFATKILTNIIKGAPTIDPVKHGHWIPIDGMSGKCSVCEEQSDYPLMCCEGTPSTRYEPYPHCPWCGAIMDQVVSE